MTLEQAENSIVSNVCYKKKQGQQPLRKSSNTRVAEKLGLNLICLGCSNIRAAVKIPEMLTKPKIINMGGQTN